MSRMWGNTEEEWIFRWDQGEGEACVFSIHLGGCYELVIRMVRLRAESMRPPLTGVRILPPSGGDGPWWGASMWRVKRLLVAVSLVAGCRGWRQTLPCPLASAWLRRGLGGDGSPDVASCAWPGLRGWWGWSATTSSAGRPLAAGPHRLAGPYRGSSGPPSSRSWPSAHSLLAPGTDEDLDVLDVHPSCRLSSHGGLVGDRSCTTYARDLSCVPAGRSAYLRLSAAGCRG